MLFNFFMHLLAIGFMAGCVYLMLWVCAVFLAIVKRAMQD